MSMWPDIAAVVWEQNIDERSIQPIAFGVVAAWLKKSQKLGALARLETALEIFNAKKVSPLRRLIAQQVKRKVGNHCRPAQE